MFTFSCAEDSSVVETSILRIEDDCNAYLSIKVPNVNDTEKDFYYTITIHYASSTITMVFEVTYIDIGDLITKDGYILHRYKSLTWAEQNSVIAIVCSVDGTKVLGLGLEESGELKWARSGTTGYNTNFTEIQGYPVNDMDGSDNWDYICSIDPIGTLDAATYYPVFNFAINYGVTAGLEGTDYEEGWYVPSLHELESMSYYFNNNLYSALLKVGGSQCTTKSYWSSTQDDEDDDYCLNLEYYSNTKQYFSYAKPKDSSYRVRVVHAFIVQ